jgi:hypothetical protein
MDDPELCEREIRERTQKEEILIVLSNYGITNLQTNGYWFQFNHKDLFVNITNQESRFILTYYDHSLNTIDFGEETHMRPQSFLHTLKHEDPHLYTEMCQVYNYHHTIIDGSNATINTEKVMELIND